MQISKETVAHISKLARLKLTESEMGAFASQLSAVLGSFNELVQVDTKDVLPLVTPTEMPVYFRADGVEKHGNSDQLLANAPEKSGTLFKVPPVVG